MLPKLKYKLNKSNQTQNEYKRLSIKENKYNIIQAYQQHKKVIEFNE